MALSKTFEFIWREYEELAAQRGPIRVLDFGCGDAPMIRRAIERGEKSEFFGADTYYGDNGYMTTAGDRLGELARERIRILPVGEGRLPFDDGMFDYVFSNSVFEHIADVPAVVAELARVTAPGGVGFHAYGTREGLWEGHVNIPLLHRIPTRRGRRAWAYPWWATKRARFAAESDRFEDWWDHRMRPFLENDTFRYPYRYIDGEFARHFDVEHVEGEKLARQLDARGKGLYITAAKIVRALPQPVSTAFETHRAMVAIRMVKR